MRGPFSPFSRCLLCNVPVEGAPKAEIRPRLEPRTLLFFDRFSRCPSCGRVYWAGSRHDRLLDLLKRLALVPSFEP